MRTRGEHGIAMIAALLVMMLISALLVGFTASVMSDQKFRGADRDRLQAFYAAHAGLEKMTADLGDYFQANYAPTKAQVNALATHPPALSGVTFAAAGGGNGYLISWASSDASGNPRGLPLTISSGPYQGLIAVLTQYTMDVTAHTAAGGEVHLRRNLETVAIPVFQFGMFSDTDLSFFPGATFNFGGRVHTNGNLFLASAGTLTFNSKVTAVGQIIRDNLSNGATLAQGPNTHTGVVSVAKAPGAFRNLLAGEGSLNGFLGAPANPSWTNISLTTYNGYLRSGSTGAHALNLPVLTSGGANPDIVRRPATATEDVTNPKLFGERYFSKVSLRILLSDTAADIQNLPSVTQGTQPISLEPAAWPPVGYNGGAGFNQTHPPIAASRGPVPVAPTTTANTAVGAANINVTSTANFPAAGTILINGVAVHYNGITATRFQNCIGTPATVAPVQVTNAYLTPVNTGTVGGFLKIELQDNNFAWRDVTLEILNQGIAMANIRPGLGCGDPTPNAILRLQRISDMPANNTPCGLGGALPAADFWPLSLFDAREGLQRDAAPAGAQIVLGGVMYYVALDVRNLSRWFQGVGPYLGLSGPLASNNNGTGYAVYFSDRRNNRNAGNLETGEYGYEDIVNVADPNGLPNGALDPGEDVNALNGLEVYGQLPSFNGVQNSVAPGTVVGSPLDRPVARPTSQLRPLQAQVNRAVLFRHALKLVNGGLGNIAMPGLAIIAENPVYIQGDWNANQAVGFGNPSAATSVAADAVTLLGNEWNDDNGFLNPYTPAARVRATNPFFRVAIISGKNPSFQTPLWQNATSDFGTDGGAHNFLRFLESGATVNYMGSIASFYYSRQATGIYKCCATVYGPPVRNYVFDQNFLNPALLPPLTPVFRDVNTLGFSQEIRPGK